MSDLTSRSESYMNDLIRRGDVLALFPTNDCSDKMVGLYERVLDIPTAYDKEKVVAELEKKRIEVQKMKNDCIALSDKEVCDIENITYDRAKDIVRKGGVE